MASVPDTWVSLPAMALRECVSHNATMRNMRTTPMRPMPRPTRTSISVKPRSVFEWGFMATDR